MDLLQKLATEINFDFHLYIVHDGLFGRRVPPPPEPTEPPTNVRKPAVATHVESQSKFDGTFNT